MKPFIALHITASIISLSFPAKATARVFREVVGYPASLSGFFKQASSKEIFHHS